MELKKCFVVALAATTLSTAHADLKSAKQVFSSGSWTVLQEIDKMTDKVSCTGIHKQDFTKQLGSDGLYIAIRGGISSVTLRFDDAPPRGMRLATKMEKDVRTVILEGEEFRSALASTRLRGQVLTLVSGIQDFELDMTGAAAAYDNILAGCPTPENAPAPTPAPAVVAPVAERSILCSPELQARMQAAGITKAQITKACVSTKP